MARYDQCRIYTFDKCANNCTRLSDVELSLWLALKRRVIAIHGILAGMYVEKVSLLNSYIRRLIEERILTYWTIEKWQAFATPDGSSNPFLINDWNVFGDFFALERIELGSFLPNNQWEPCVMAQYAFLIDGVKHPVVVCVAKNKVAYIEMDSIFRYAKNNSQFDLAQFLESCLLEKSSC